jgi:hypothetical protein
VTHTHVVINPDGTVVPIGHTELPALLKLNSGRIPTTVRLTPTVLATYALSDDDTRAPDHNVPARNAIGRLKGVDPRTLYPYDGPVAFHVDGHKPGRTPLSRKDRIHLIRIAHTDKDPNP